MKKDYYTGYKAGDYIYIAHVRQILECYTFGETLRWNQVDQGIAYSNYAKNKESRYRQSYSFSGIRLATSQEIIAAGFKTQEKVYEL